MGEKEVRAIRFRITLDIELPDESVFITDEAYYDEFKNNTELMQNAYFNKDKIKELKKELCDMIMSSKNPFSIYDVDYDVYPVREDKIWE